MAARAARGALGAALAGAAVSLSGCSVVREADFGDKASSLQVCPGFEFRDGGYVSQAQAGESVKVNCPTDFVYDGPAIECSWADRVCIGILRGDVDPELCWNQFNLTLLGRGLTVWPDGVRPRVIPPPGAGKNSSAQLRAASRRSLANGGGLLLEPAEGDGDSFEREWLDEGDAAGRRLLERRSRMLPTIIQPEQLVCKGESFVELDFERAEMAHSNLGGQGPDEGAPRSLHYRRIAKVDGDQVDLMVTTSHGDRLGLPERNGKGSVMGRVSLNGTSPVHLRFQFVSAATKMPVVLPKVMFTLFDLWDDGHHPNVEVDVAGASEYFASAEAALLMEAARGADSDGGCSYAIGSAARANESASEHHPSRPRALEDDSGRKASDREKSVEEMWQSSVNRSVVFVFRSRSEFSIAARAKPGPAGWDLEFAGWSEVAELGRRTICDAAGPSAGSRLEEKFQVSSGPARQGSQERDSRLRGCLSSLGMAAAAVSAVVASRLARGVLSRRVQYGVLHAV